MKTSNAVRIRSEDGSALCVRLERCEDREVATVFIDDVPYHIERMPKDLLCREYKVDSDPDYVPKTDSSNRCVVITPFSQK